MESPITRILDVNANRAAEALRVVEDAVRFALNDERQVTPLRGLRHELAEAIQSVPGLFERLLAARDSEGDVHRAAPHLSTHAGLLEVVAGNLGRAQEATRALEEFSRCLQPALAQRFGEIRFRLYDVERALLPGLRSHALAAKLDFELYVVISSAFCHGRDVVDVACAAVEGGARAIQLREKEMPKGPLFALAMRMRRAVPRERATLIINDHLDVAMASGADGVHLGQSDLPVAAARALVDDGFVIGASTHDIVQAKAALEAGANYINCGPVFATRTKAVSCAPVGTEMVRKYAELRDTTPGGFAFTSMGGIKASNVAEVVAAGADKVAVVTAVTAADNITDAARALLRAIQGAKQARAVAGSVGS